MIDTVIFDMDGVLVNSEPAIRRACVVSLAEYGITAYEDDFKQFTGMGDDKFVGGVAELRGGVYDTAMKERAFEIYFANPQDVEVYRWSKYLIERLKREGYKVAVASASDKRKVNYNLGLVGVEPESLNAVLSGTDVVKKKPDPEIFLKAAEKAGAEPAKSVVIEDAISGVQAAKAAGMKCIAVTTSFDAAKLKAAGADYVAADLMSACEVISNLISKM